LKEGKPLIQRRGLCDAAPSAAAMPALQLVGLGGEAAGRGVVQLHPAAPSAVAWFDGTYTSR
jgi:hypothetical protein